MPSDGALQQLDGGAVHIGHAGFHLDQHGVECASPEVALNPVVG